MKKYRAMLQIIIFHLCLFISLNTVVYSQDANLQKCLSNIESNFVERSIAKLDPYLSDSNRVYIDWEDLFALKGYYGKSQLNLFLQKYFKNYDILSAQIPVAEIKYLDEDKALIKLLLNYKNKITSEIIFKNIFFLIEKQKNAVTTKNPAGWIIIEIKTIN